MFVLSEENFEHSDKTDEKIQKLISLSNDFGIKAVPTKTIIEHTHKSKRHYEPKSRTFLPNLKPKKKSESTSIFSEEDFERFSKEYFVNSDTINKTTLEKKKTKELGD